MSTQQTERETLRPGTVQYKVETRTITLVPPSATPQELELRLRNLELQLEALGDESKTSRARLVTMAVSGLAAVLFGGLSVITSISGNEGISLSLLTPAFVGTVSAITLAFLVLRDQD